MQMKCSYADSGTPLALRWMSSDFSWRTQACSLYPALQAGLDYPRILTVYSTTPTTSQIGPTLTWSCSTQAFTCEVLVYNGVSCMTGTTVYSQATCTTAWNATTSSYQTSMSYTPNIDHLNLMFRFTLTGNTCQTACSSNGANMPQPFSIVACGAASHTINKLGSDVF